MVQMMKDLLAMQETWVPSLDPEDLQEEGITTHSSNRAWRMNLNRGAWQAAVHVVSKNWTRLSN